MRCSRGITLAAVAAAFLAVSADAGEAGSLAAGEIIVTTEKVAGSSLPKMIVRGVIDAPPSEVWEIVSDCDVYEKRLPRIRAARVVDRSGDEVVCEVTVALPFPLSDLTAVTRATHVEGPPRWTRRWTLVEGDYEVNDGSWVLEELEDDAGRTLATYSVHAVPRGSIPGWARRRAQESSLPDVIERLRSETTR